LMVVVVVVVLVVMVAAAAGAVVVEGSGRGDGQPASLQEAKTPTCRRKCFYQQWRTLLLITP
jgi:hypothetical protein